MKRKEYLNIYMHKLSFHWAAPLTQNKETLEIKSGCGENFKSTDRLEALHICSFLQLNNARLSV